MDNDNISMRRCIHMAWISDYIPQDAVKPRGNIHCNVQSPVHKFLEIYIMVNATEVGIFCSMGR